MTAHRRDLVMHQGDDYTHQLVWRADGNPIPVGGNTWTAQIKTTVDAATALATFGVNDSAAAAGIVHLTLASSVTETLPEWCVWDLRQQSSTGAADYILRGTVRGHRRVTSV